MDVMITILSAATTTLASVVAYLYKRDTKRSDTLHSELKIKNKKCEEENIKKTKQIAKLFTDFALFRQANSIRCSAIDCPLHKNDPNQKTDS